MLVILPGENGNFVNKLVTTFRIFSGFCWSYPQGVHGEKLFLGNRAFGVSETGVRTDKMLPVRLESLRNYRAGSAHTIS